MYSSRTVKLNVCAGAVRPPLSRTPAAMWTVYVTPVWVSTARDTSSGRQSDQLILMRSGSMPVMETRPSNESGSIGLL